VSNEFDYVGLFE